MEFTYRIANSNHILLKKLSMIFVPPILNAAAARLTKVTRMNHPTKSPTPNLIDANRIRRAANDALAKAYHDTIWAQCMLAHATRIAHAATK